MEEEPPWKRRDRKRGKRTAVEHRGVESCPRVPDIRAGGVINVAEERQKKRTLGLWRKDEEGSQQHELSDSSDPRWGKSKLVNSLNRSIADSEVCSQRGNSKSTLKLRERVDRDKWATKFRRRSETKVVERKKGFEK